jgi:cation diffusion facilitator CzcD-associated flavoprotein CzcO
LSTLTAEHPVVAAGEGSSLERCQVIIVGAGFSGLGTAIRLRQAGVDDVIVLERAEGPGGTWRDNHYPGAACDIRSHLYSFSFAPNPSWSRSFSPQPEIEAYLRACVERFSLHQALRCKHEVLEARFDDQAQEWEVETNQGTWRAPVLVWATGPLSEPKVPDIAGLSSFQGEVFHSAAWRDDLDLSGRRVAVIGTGASAIQFIPQIQPVVDRLVVFQRTPPWVVPRRDHPISPLRRRLYRALPLTQRLVRLGIYLQQELLAQVMMARPKALQTAEAIARKHLEDQVADEAHRLQADLGVRRLLPGPHPGQRDGGHPCRPLGGGRVGGRRRRGRPRRRHDHLGHRLQRHRAHLRLPDHRPGR